MTDDEKSPYILHGLSLCAAGCADHLTPEPVGMLSAPVMQTIMGEGIKGMYKGMGAPLATVALFNAVLFASRGQMQAFLAHRDGGSARSRCQQPVWHCSAALVECAGQFRPWAGASSAAASLIKMIPAFLSD